MRQSRSVTVTLEERQNSLQSITCNKSPTIAKLNGPHPDKSIDFVPLNLRSTELHLNEIGMALNEFESKKNSIHIGNPSTLPFTKLSPYASMENNYTIPAPTGNISAAFNSDLHP